MPDLLMLAADAILGTMMKKATEAGSSALVRKLSQHRTNNNLMAEHLKQTTLQLSRLVTYRPFPQQIEDVYVHPLIMDETLSLANISVDQYEIISKMVQNLEDFSIESIFPQLQNVERRSDIKAILQNIKTLSPDEFAESDDSCIILGEAGAGKSSFLQYLCYRRVQNLHHRLPIYIESIDLRNNSVLPILQERAYKFGLDGENLRHLGSALSVYIDGLDELEMDKYRLVCREIETLIRTYPDIIVCAAIRSSVYKGELAFLGEKTLLPFDEKRALLFVDKWFGSDDVNRTHAGSLIKDIQSSDRIRDLSTQPLLLCLMCNAVRRYSQISRRPSNLYQQCVDSLLWEWDSRRLVKRQSYFSNIDLEKLTWIHSELGYRLHLSGHRFIGKLEIEFIISNIIPKYGLKPEDSRKIIDEITANHGIFVKFTD